MYELVLRQADVAQIRFAQSPVHELVASAVTLHDASRQPMHRRWLRWVRPRLAGHRFDRLFALTAGHRYVPEFLTPVCGAGTGDLDEELERVAGTGEARIRGELDEMVRTGPDGGPPAAVRGLHDDPGRHLGPLVDELRAYWRLAVEPVWDRVFALTADDVGYRLRQFADEGIGRVLNSVSPRVSYHDGVVSVDQPHRGGAQGEGRPEGRHDLAGAGLLLLPCVFVWPTVAVGSVGGGAAAARPGEAGPGWAQPSIAYPPRGLGTVWEERGDPGGADALGALVGRTRAAMLDALGLPVTTTQLATRLGISPAAASQHLQVLKAAALVHSRRQGRLVLYQRTPAGTVLHTAARRP